MIIAIVMWSFSALAIAAVVVTGYIAVRGILDEGW